MKKYFSRGVLATFIIASVFVFGAFTPVAKVSAAAGSTCDMVNLLIMAGVISAEKAPAVLAAFNCSTVAPYPGPVITRVAAIASENNEIEAGAKFIIEGSNLQSGLKDTAVYFNGVGAGGDKETFFAQITQISNSLIWAIAPTQLRAGQYYDLYVNNGGYEPAVSQATQVRVMGGTSTSTSYYISIAGDPVLQLFYDSAQKESELKATFDLSITASADKDLYVYQRANSVTFINQTNNNLNYFWGTSNIQPVSSLATGVDTKNQSYYIIPKGTTEKFTALSVVSPKILFAGSYVAKFNSVVGFYGNPYSAFSIDAPDNRTNDKLIIGEVSPYINSVDSPITVDSTGGMHVVIKGVRFSPTNNSIMIGTKEFPGFASKNNGTLLDLYLGGMGIPSGYQTVYVMNLDQGREAGKSNNVWSPVAGSTSTTTTEASITVLSPNGGETWTRGTDQVIKWENGKEPVQIGIVKDTFPKDRTIIGWILKSAAIDGKITWDTMNVKDLSGKPLGVVPSGSYKIIVVAPNAAGNSCFDSNPSSACNYDVSDSYFKIVAPPTPVVPSITVLSPNGGEKLVQGKQYAITWNGNMLSTVFASLVPANSTGNGEGVIGIIGNVSSGNTIYWDPKSVFTDSNSGAEIAVKPGTYKIYLVGNLAGVAGKTVNDMSDSYFKIVAPVVTPINGVCSTALNTCESGTFSDLVDTATSYLWTCNGLDGGKNSSCSRIKPIVTPIATPINGVCGGKDTCTSGTFVDIADTEADYLWKCKGTDGGTNSSCSKPIPPAVTPVDAVCGVKLNVCTSGNFVDLDDTATDYKWKCKSITGGATAWCSRVKPVTEANSDQNYATALGGWDSFVKLLKSL